jgi:hypothetical protein
LPAGHSPPHENALFQNRCSLLFSQSISSLPNSGYYAKWGMALLGRKNFEILARFSRRFAIEL